MAVHVNEMHTDIRSAGGPRERRRVRERRRRPADGRTSVGASHRAQTNGWPAASAAEDFDD